MLNSNTLPIMKKFILLLLCTFTGLCTLNAMTPMYPLSVDNVVSSNKGEISFKMYGVLGGGETDAYMTMSGNTGTFEYNGIVRKLKLESYNQRTGRLIIKEFDSKGKFIGRFDGTYTYSKEYPGSTYNGVFTNYNGKKVDFSLHKLYY